MTPTLRFETRSVRLSLALAIACLVAATGCGNPTPPATAPVPPTAAPTEQSLEDTDADGTLAPPEQAENAYTYDPALAPPGARISVEAGEAGDSTHVRLQVHGFLPDRGYAAHVHARPCGPTGAVAGPHYQHDMDPAATPEKPSTDPAYANPQNEIWLDLRTNAGGNAEVNTEVPFVFNDRAPGSVVIHKAEATATAPGQAGTAGDRIACLAVQFR